MEERIQKILARAGYGSRRSCEEMITAGRIKINGITAILGSKADGTLDKIQVDGRTLTGLTPENIYIALNKPRGVLSDEDPQDSRPSVRDLVPVPGHLFTVGRLDLESEGLILLTNDGEMANRLTHPRYGHEKEYRVLVSSRPDDKQLEAWRRGVVMEDGYKTAPADVIVEGVSGKGAFLRIILREGKKRQIREVGKILGLHVVKILRIRIGGLELGNLKPREWRYLTPEEVTGLTKVGAGKFRFRSQTRKPSTRGKPSPGRASIKNSETQDRSQKSPKKNHNSQGSARKSERQNTGDPEKRRYKKPTQ